MVIVDAGGGTVDISSYNRNQKGNFEEIAPPQCSFVIITLKITNSRSLYLGHFHGSVFVTFYARRFLESMSLPKYDHCIIT